MWKKLAQLQSEMLWRGSLFVFSATYPFEEKVVLMLCEHQMGEEPFNFVTITGAKAGIDPYVILPKQCLFDEKNHAVSTECSKRIGLSGFGQMEILTRCGSGHRYRLWIFSANRANCEDCLLNAIEV